MQASRPSRSSSERIVTNVAVIRLASWSGLLQLRCPSSRLLPLLPEWGHVRAWGMLLTGMPCWSALYPSLCLACSRHAGRFRHQLSVLFNSVHFCLILLAPSIASGSPSFLEQQMCPQGSYWNSPPEQYLQHKSMVESEQLVASFEKVMHEG